MSFLRLLKFALPILLGLGVLSVIVFDPFGSDSQKVLLLGGLVAFAAWAVLRHSREADEVEMAATKFGATTGATIGLLTAFVFVVAMRLCTRSGCEHCSNCRYIKQRTAAGCSWVCPRIAFDHSDCSVYGHFCQGALVVFQELDGPPPPMPFPLFD